MNEAACMFALRFYLDMARWRSSLDVLFHFFFYSL